VATVNEARFWWQGTRHGHVRSTPKLLRVPAFTDGLAESIQDSSNHSVVETARLDGLVMGVGLWDVVDAVPTVTYPKIAA
jgi:hypothetical protein